MGATGANAWPKSGHGPGPASGSAASDFIFVDSNAAQLAGIKRVIIINYVIAFQTQGTSTPASMGSSITTVGTNSWDNVDTNMLQQITDNGLAKLKSSFRERNIEVLDESVLINQPDYAKILQATGFDAPVNWANSDGKALLGVYPSCIRRTNRVYDGAWHRNPSPRRSSFASFLTTKPASITCSTSGSGRASPARHASALRTGIASRQSGPIRASGAVTTYTRL
jgi:hypothetical protein